jgi:hypothetical protein
LQALCERNGVPYTSPDTDWPKYWCAASRGTTFSLISNGVETYLGDSFER